MQEYADKNALVSEIRNTANIFIKEFDDIGDSEKDIRYDGVDRTPQEIIAYQLGWMELIRGWNDDEAKCKEVVTPAPGYKWNQLGGLYQGFYEKHRNESLEQLRISFIKAVEDIVEWLNDLSDDELFLPGGRKWAASTSANWPVWKWVHMNTVAPFKSFRTKIRKWKKLNASR